MDTEGFRQFLQRRNIPEDKVEPFIFIADKFEGSLQGRKPGSSDVEIFAMRLIREGLNTWDHFIALACYDQFLGNNEVYREAITLLDGSEVLDNLHERLACWWANGSGTRSWPGLICCPWACPLRTSRVSCRRSWSGSK